MKTIAVVTLAALLATAAVAAEPESGGKPVLSCEIGPTSKEIAKAQWLVYGCADRSSAIIVSGEPEAGPFYVMIFAKSGQYRIHGEGGTSQQQIAALKALRAMTSKQLSVLAREANQGG